MKTDLDYATESLEETRAELTKLRHALAEAESQLANMRDRNAAGRDLADSVKRIVTEEIVSHIRGDSFEDNVRSVVEYIVRDLIKNATVEVDTAWIKV